MWHKYILSLLLSLTLINSSLYSQVNTKSKKDINKGTYSYDSIVNEQSKFKFCYFDNEKGIISIRDISIFSNNKLIQKIETNKNNTIYEINDELHKEELIDYNFDGIKDISINTNCGATGNCSYLVWLYSKKDNQYHFAKELSGMGLELDKIGKNIIYHYREGWPAEYWDTYKYINGKFTWIKGVYVKNTNTYSETTYRYMKNGKVVTKKIRN